MDHLPSWSAHRRTSGVSVLQAGALMLRNFDETFELRDGVFYYIGTNRAPDFTSTYWQNRMRYEKEEREKR